jgi:sec-independent protein translocase protein TatA
MFGGLGTGEIMLIFLVVLLLFGAKKLPEVGSALGKGIREFKSSIREIEHEINIPDDRNAHRATPPPTDEPGEPRKLSDGSAKGGEQDA